MHDEYLLKLREIDYNNTNTTSRITDNTTTSSDDDKYQVYAIQEEDLLIAGL